MRIIAATNRDLQEEIAKGSFREDLFYRLSVFSIKLPALRERRKDIPSLAKHYADQFSIKIKGRSAELTDEYLAALQQAEWKGNIRELRNAIERSVILSDSHVLDVDSLPVDMQQRRSGDKLLSAFSMASAEKLHIQKILNHTGGNKAEAARLLEIGIATLYRKIEEYGF